MLTLFSCRSNHRRSTLSEPHFRLLSPFSGLPGSFLSFLYSKEGPHVFLLSPVRFSGSFPLASLFRRATYLSPFSCPVSRLVSSRFSFQKGHISFSFLLSGLPALSYLLASLYTSPGKKELIKKQFFAKNVPEHYAARERQKQAPFSDRIRRGGLFPNTGRVRLKFFGFRKSFRISPSCNAWQYAAVPEGSSRESSPPRAPLLSAAR